MKGLGSYSNLQEEIKSTSEATTKLNIKDIIQLLVCHSFSLSYLVLKVPINPFLKSVLAGAPCAQMWSVHRSGTKEGRAQTCTGAKSLFAVETKLALLHTRFLYIKMSIVIPRVPLRKLPQQYGKISDRKLKYHTRLYLFNTKGSDNGNEGQKWHNTYRKQQNGRCKSYLLSNCINVSGLNSPIKQQRLENGLKIYIIQLYSVYKRDTLDSKMQMPVG